MLSYNSLHAFSAQNNLCFSSKSYCCMSYTDEMYSVLPTLHLKTNKHTALWRCNSPTIQFTHLQWQWFLISFFCFFFLTTGLRSFSLFSFFTMVVVVGGAPVWILAPILTGALLSGYACVSHSIFCYHAEDREGPWGPLWRRCHRTARSTRSEEGVQVTLWRRVLRNAQVVEPHLHWKWVWIPPHEPTAQGLLCALDCNKVFG